MQYIGVIYKITNTQNSKIYIGKTTSTIQKRFYAHVYDSLKNVDNHSHLHNAIRKDGKENFTIEIIDQANSIEELNEKEIYWISKFNSQDPDIGYNIAKGGEGGPGIPAFFKNHHHKISTRKQMSETRKGANNSNYGNHWHQSEELKRKHSELSKGENNSMFGKKHSEKSKLKNRQKHLGKKAYSNMKLNKVIMLFPEDGDLLIKNDPDWFLGNIHRK